MKPNMKSNSLPRWLRYGYRIVIVLIWAIIFAFCVHYKDSFTVDNILNNAPGNQFIAFLVILGLSALKSASIFIYCGIIYIASGLIFPFPLALLANICGSIVMYSLPYFIGKKLGHSAVEYISHKYPKVEILKKLRSSHDFKFTYIVRIISVLPLDLVSLYMGAVNVDYRFYLLGSTLALFPTMALLTIMGKNAMNPGSPQFILATCFEVLYMLAAGIFSLNTLKKHYSKSQAEEI